jgi:hypothetical protein
MAIDNVALRYRLGPKDYMALSRAMSRSMFERLLGVGIYILAGLAGLVSGAALGGSDAFQKGTGIVFAGAYGGLIYLMQLWYWRGFLEGTERFADISIVAKGSGVTYQTGPLETTGPWTAFSTVKVTSSHVFLFLTPRQALIIPRSAFSKREDEEVLLAWAVPKKSSGNGA